MRLRYIRSVVVDAVVVAVVVVVVDAVVVVAVDLFKLTFLCHIMLHSDIRCLQGLQTMHLHMIPMSQSQKLQICMSQTSKVGSASFPSRIVKVSRCVTRECGSNTVIDPQVAL